MGPFEAALLGLIQALTEFLPVSSSGHLVLGQALLGVEHGADVAFEVAVHFGTLLSVLVLFRAEVRRLFAATWRGVRAPQQLGTQWRDDPDLRLVAAVLIGCVPAGVVGVLFKSQLETAFGSPYVVGWALLVTGAVLLLSQRAAIRGGEVTVGRATWIGIAQALAITPGISRSGSTIAAGMFLGVDPERAARYSFLMSIPVIAGATLLEARELAAAPPSSDVLVALGLGLAVSFVAGLGALWLLMSVVRRGWFHKFGWYCLAVGAAALTYLHLS